MPLDEGLFLHDADKAAMQALKAIPGFSAFVKAYMGIWNERQFRVINMSSNLRIGPNQLRRYYDMLVPICKKLDIAVPELYLEMNVAPNSYTYGDTRPFIVLTSGLFDALPEALIPTVLAHECGHIACHHTMYTTMGSIILGGAEGTTGLLSLVTTPLKMAYAYWQRCSEFSADRAAILCDGGPEKMIEVCMRFAGYGKGIPIRANVNAFMEQAKEYREMIKSSRWNKTLEFLQFSLRDHPLTAVRAWECRAWAQSEQFTRLHDYLAAGQTRLIEPQALPMPDAARALAGRDVREVLRALLEAGFTNIKAHRSPEGGLLTRAGQVLRISADGDPNFEKGSWFAPGVPIVVTYYDPDPSPKPAK